MRIECFECRQWCQIISYKDGYIEFFLYGWKEYWEMRRHKADLVDNLPHLPKFQCTFNRVKRTSMVGENRKPVFVELPFRDSAGRWTRWSPWLAYMVSIERFLLRFGFPKDNSPTFCFSVYFVGVHELKSTQERAHSLALEPFWARSPPSLPRVSSFIIQEGSP
jgi:hypothetical protein